MFELRFAYELGVMAAVLTYLCPQRIRIYLPNAKVHALTHMIVESQVVLGDDYPVAATLERLMGEGLDRHEAIHAIGFVLMANIFDIQQGRIKGDVNEVYVRELAGLTAGKWRSEA